MRSRTIIASIFALLLGATAAAQDFSAYEDEQSVPPSFTARWVLPEDGVRLRDKPSTDGKTLGVIPAGTKLEVIEKRQPEVAVNDLRGYWLKVKSPIGTGWSFSGFLRPYDPAKLALEGANLAGAWAQADGTSCEFTESYEYYATALPGMTRKWDINSENLLVSDEDGFRFNFDIRFLSANRLELGAMGMRIVLYRLKDARYDQQLDSLSAE